MTDARKGFTSASNAQADSLCPGRHLAQAGLPDVVSPDAEYGNQIHAVLAKIPNPPSIEALHGLPEFKSLAPTQQDIAESCLKIELEKVREFFGNDAPSALNKCFRERRDWIQVNPGVFHSGAVDVVYRLGPRALVVDYKSLAGDKPESAENLQLRDLVCLAAGNLMAAQVGCVIVQPLATHSPDTCRYEKEDIVRSTQEMIERVRASNNRESKRVAGPVQCQFCKAKTKCPEYAAFSASKLPVQRGYVTTPVERWTPEERASFCEAFDIAQTWLNACWEFMENGAKNDPDFVPGWGLVPNSPMKPILNAQALFDRMCELGKPDEILPLFMGCVDVGKTKVKAVVSELTGLKGVALTKKCEQLFAGLTGEIPKKASLKKK